MSGDSMVKGPRRKARRHWWQVVLGGGSSSAGNMGVGRSDSQSRQRLRQPRTYLVYRYQRRWPSACLQVRVK
jgi:hypothetical protein